MSVHSMSLHFTSLQNKITSHKSRQFTSYNYTSLHFKTKSLHINHVSSLHITTLHFTFLTQSPLEFPCTKYKYKGTLYKMRCSQRLSQSYAWLLQWFKRGQKDENWKLTERRNFTPCGLWSRLDFTFSKFAACFWVIHVPFSKALECCGYSSCLFCRDVSFLIRFSSSYLAPFQASHPHEISSFPATTMMWRVLAVLTSSFADRQDFSYWI